MSDRTGITVGFSTTNKLMSRFIRWITQGKVSHAWIAYDDATLGMRMVMQAEAWGFEVRPWKKWLTQNKWVAEYTLVCPVVVLTKSLKKLAELLGTHYDYKSAALVGIINWFKRLSKSKFKQSPKKLMCAEAVVRFLQWSNFSSTINLNPEITSPAELFGVIGTDINNFISLSTPIE